MTITEEDRLSAPNQNVGESSDSFVTVYLNSLPGLYAMVSQEKKHGLELDVRGWLLSGFQSDLDQKVARVFDIKDFGPLPLMQDFSNSCHSFSSCTPTECIIRQSAWQASPPRGCATTYST